MSVMIRISYAKKMITKMQKLGLTHILGASVANKMLALVTNMLIVRCLTKNAYGNYSFAYNIISIVLIFSDFGTKISRFQYCLETNDLSERHAITRFSIIIGSITSISIGVLIFLYATFVHLSLPDAKVPLQMLSLFLLVQFFYDQLLYDFRIRKDNKHFALLTNINTSTYLVFACCGAIIANTSGMIIGRYIAYIIPLIVGVMWLNKDKQIVDQRYKLDNAKKIDILKYGLLIVLTNSVSSVLYYFDAYFVGIITRNSTILADYKIATMIPTALNFLPAACVTFVYPYFVEHKDDSKWLITNMHKWQLLTAIPNGFIVMGGLFFAPTIIKFVFGKEYLTAVPIFRILMITYFITATFRIIYGNILAMMHLVKVNFFLGTLECLVNIILDVVMIKKMGSIGAAYVTMIITVFSSFLSGIYFLWYAKKCKRE